MQGISKRFKEAKSKVDRAKQYEVGEAIELLQSLPRAKFDETVEIAVKLGINVKQSDQMVRGSLRLPHGLGKKVRVVAFADGSDIEKAQQAGAVEVGNDDLIKKISDGWLDFDVAVAHKSLMSKVGKLGRLLGPKGLMPSPKAGTVTENIVETVKEFVAGKIEFRADDAGIVHSPVGKLSFPKEKLVDNVNAFVEHIYAIRPASAKGIYLQKVSISSTMGPGIALKIG